MPKKKFGQKLSKFKTKMHYYASAFCNAIKKSTLKAYNYIKCK